MVKLIEQIIFFRFLKLRPVSEENHERWEREIKNDSIRKEMRECYVVLEKINPNDQNKLSQRLKRKKKIKKCCIWCERL